MVWNKQEYDHIPGTYVFDGRKSSMGYRLNKMCMSFNHKENREQFANDMEAYCRKYELSEETTKAVLAGDWLQLLRLGGNIYYLAKVAIFHGQSVQDACAIMQNMTTDQFKQKLLDNSAGIAEKKNKAGGFYG
ncbi:protocatechuate 3,4-dioxygenase [Gynuella sp.]|uniref:protocatechuate 3,4-dioxygenase n=1 Tax=Gynuella sp. TaxID=2969146 RepID=UPI003D0E6B30